MPTLAGCLLGASQPSAPTRLDVTYLANEGFLLRAGGRSVLVDALFHQGVPGYARIPDDARRRLETDSEPFDGVDAVLVTHRHADHFDAEAVAAFLRRSARATLVASTEVVRAVRMAAGLDASALDTRLVAVAESAHLRTMADVNGVGIEALRIPHANVEHVGFLMRLGGLTVAHVGDSDGTLADYAALGLSREPLDVAFVPDWMLLHRGGQQIVREHLRATHIVAMHVALEDGPDGELHAYVRGFGGHAGMARRVREAFPGTVMALTPGQTFAFDRGR